MALSTFLSCVPFLETLAATCGFLTPFYSFPWGLDVSDAGGVFDLICEQLDGETLSAKGAKWGEEGGLSWRLNVSNTEMAWGAAWGLLFSLETLQILCFLRVFLVGWFRECDLLNGCGWRISTIKIRELGSDLELESNENEWNSTDVKETASDPLRI